MRKYLIVLVSVFVGVFLSEAVVRLTFGDRFGQRPGFYIADPQLGWKPAPNLKDTFYSYDYNIRIETDADGARLGSGGKIDYSKDLILVLGDSYTFGWGVNTEESFPSYLDEAVNKATQGQTRVVNLAVGGYGTLQYALRLQEFLKNHPDVNVKAVIVNHCSNDVRDNFKSFGYPLGIWKVQTAVKPRHWSHLWNLLNYVIEMSVLRIQNFKGQHDFDSLFAIKRTAPVETPARFRINQASIDLSKINKEVLEFNGESFTPEQQDLMRECLLSFHRILKENKKETRIFHGFVHNSDRFFVHEMQKLIFLTPAFGNRVKVLGEFPPHGSYLKGDTNKHSGGHFTPEFNKFWASQMMTELQKEEIF